MNGLTRDEIEERAKRSFSCGGNTFNDIYSCRGGYHEFNETIDELIKLDSIEISKLHTTKEVLVLLIKNALLKTELIGGVDISEKEEKSDEQIISFKEYKLIFDGKEWINQELVKYCQPQKLIIRRKEEKGYQYSLFYNPSLIESPLNTRWNCEYKIINETTGLSMTIGGNASVGVIQFIEKFGYFEGKKGENKYRIEPSFVLAILCGIISQQTIETYNEYINIKSSLLKQTISTLYSRLKLTQDFSESNWIHKQITKSELLLKQNEEKWDKCKNQLKKHLIYGY
ncbi:hypothetical protein EDI_284190 [Entamoeba dispar SAW760]|uniref:Uncharacterized protein n=1 Tax=Entamoeba dispar (strain ATCC PRA-260 / SAW760) TaxID=370354 RepID=B0E5F8_ENTDS|nr:uncharacterized protein EDI_284190 [Entamoeba dispar SAW760]EDR30250.1 hypothetical protein EDI_284190 [Entamoeba dispar SAW760]|eukprot:EDR30250.1 hypothetical protein EDI_284190 [Entamoeba dispar SAW760]